MASGDPLENEPFSLDPWSTSKTEFNLSYTLILVVVLRKNILLLMHALSRLVLWLQVWCGHAALVITVPAQNTDKMCGMLVITTPAQNTENMRTMHESVGFAVRDYES